MLYWLIWFIIFSLLLLWSLAAWAFQAAVAWTISHAGTLAGGVGGIDALQIPNWLAPWISPEIMASVNSMMVALAPSIEGLLAWAPATATGISVLIWVGWGIGGGFLIFLGFLATGLIAVLRGVRSKQRPPLETKS